MKKQKRHPCADMVGHTTKHYKIISRGRDGHKRFSRCECFQGHVFLYKDSRDPKKLLQGLIACIQCEKKDNTKMCWTCGEYKELDNYTNCKSTTDGLKRHCRKCVTLKHNEWSHSYKPWRKKKHKDYRKRRYKQDHMARFVAKIRGCIIQSFKLKGYRKPIKTEAILGCKFEDFRPHLILTAINNYGYWAEPITYEVDHIIPISWATTQEEVVRLNHHSNLQLLTPEDNIKKLNHIYDPVVDHKTFTKEATCS